MLTLQSKASAQNTVSSNKPHAVVIGSGFGGLAAAVRLGARGYRVTVLEKLDAPGGRAYVYRQDGFTFDAGPTVITAPFLFEELWALCGRRLADDIDLRPVAPYYRIGLPASMARRAPARRADVPVAAGRRQPVRHHLGLLPDRLPEAALGRALPDGRPPAAS